MRRMFRYAVSAGCALAWFIGAPSSPASSGSALARVSRPRIAYAAERADTTPVSRCVNAEKADTDVGMDLSFSNDCDLSVACAVRWTVVCEGAKGKRSIAGARSLRMAESAKAEIHISAEACGNESWTIDDPSWKCDPASRGK